MLRFTVAASALVLISIPATADPDAKPKQAAGERMICKKSVETGSLARSKKQCFTKTEWDRLADGHRKNSDDIIDNNRSRVQFN